MTARGTLTLTLLAFFPVPSAASDPTGLWVMFVGFPAVLLAASILALAFVAPKISLISSIALLAAHVPVVRWSSEVGYMNREGWMLYLSMSLCAIGLMVSGVKLFVKPAGNKAPGYAWNCHACSATNDGTANTCIRCGCPANAAAKNISRYAKNAAHTNDT